MRVRARDQHREQRRKQQRKRQNPFSSLLLDIFSNNTILLVAREDINMKMKMKMDRLTTLTGREGFNPTHWK
jgi:hypothetical protein